MEDLTDEQILMAYVLRTEFKFTISQIAVLMNASYSTIRAIIISVGYEVTINDLSKEINKTKQLLLEKGFTIQI